MKRRVSTTSKEIYTKFKHLFVVPEVVVRGVRTGQIEKIIKGINGSSGSGKVLALEKLGDKTIIKRIGHLNFEIYLK